MSAVLSPVSAVELGMGTEELLVSFRDRDCNIGRASVCELKD